MNQLVRKFLSAKLHDVTITEANLDYEGSITIPEDILEISGMKPHESVHVWNKTKGTRLETYILKGLPESRHFAINGAAAHLVSAGDRVIIASFCWVSGESTPPEPKVLFFDSNNIIKELRPEKLP